MLFLYDNNNIRLFWLLRHYKVNIFILYVLTILSMFMVILPCNLESKNIFQISSLFYVKIRVEAYKTSDPIFLLDIWPFIIADNPQNGLNVETIINKRPAINQLNSPKMLQLQGITHSQVLKMPFFLLSSNTKENETNRSQPANYFVNS